MKIYHYQCERCYFNIDNKERMEKHCLLAHGVTGEFKKGFKTITKYKKIEAKMNEPEIETDIHVKMEPVSEPVTVTKSRWKRKYLINGKQAPSGAKVFTGESGKQYYIKEIAKKNSYITE